MRTQKPGTSRTRAAALAVLLGASSALSLSAGTAFAHGGYADLVEQVSPAVVSVEVTVAPTPVANRETLPPGFPLEDLERRFGFPFGEMPGMPGRQVEGMGTGFIIGADGTIVTNYHVVENAETVQVRFADGSSRDARVLGSDPLTDIAVLKVEGAGELPVLTFGDSDALRVGDEVVAIGNPFGLSGTVTSGIVSAKSRDINAGPFDDLIQTDAAINRGNSGGPLLNGAGEVVGMNTAIFSPDGGSVGIGFAVPANMIRDIVADIEDDGTVARGWLGVQIRPVSEDVASALGLEDAGGAVVERVEPGSPAADAGLQSGDIVMAFGDAPIKAVRDLTRAVASEAPDSTASIEVLRRGERITLDVTLGSRAGKDA